MALYPSCLLNRIEEAKRHLKLARKADPNSWEYPYHLIDLSVRMRPIVEAVDKERRNKSYMTLLTFERSISYPKNDKYMGESRVDIMVILGAIIHEQYIAIQIGSQQGDEGTIQLDVRSDRGRWIVKFSEFLEKLQSYILSRDEVAIVVCDMIDNHRRLVEKDKTKMIPPVIGNYDLEWLLWKYAVREIELKRIIMNKVFNISKISEEILAKLKFSANNLGNQNFRLYFTPYDWRDENSEYSEVISWRTLSKIFRSHLDNKIA